MYVQYMPTFNYKYLSTTHVHTVTRKSIIRIVCVLIDCLPPQDQLFAIDPVFIGHKLNEASEMICNYKDHSGLMWSRQVIMKILMYVHMYVCISHGLGLLNVKRYSL